MTERDQLINRLKAWSVRPMFGSEEQPFPPESALQLVDIAVDQDVEEELRVVALISLDRHATLDFSVLHKLLEVLDGTVRNVSPELLTRAVRLLARHGTARLVKHCTRRLEYVLWHSQSKEVRRATFRALEVLGEVDVVERLCMLPCADADDVEGLKGVIGAVLRKRRWIRGLNQPFQGATGVTFHESSLLVPSRIFLVET